MSDSKPENSYGAEHAGKYLTFRLDAEEYGIPISVVQRIIHMTTITPVPLVPDYVRGVINHQGKVIPIVDMKTCFGMGEFDTHEENCIVVLNCTTEDHTLRSIGVLVERVREVIAIAGDDIQPPPDSLDHIDNAYVLGLANLPTGIRILLDMNAFVINQNFNTLLPTERED